MSPHLLAISSGGALVDLDGTFFVQLGLFLFMFVFLYLALFRPAIRLIEARREATDGTKERAIAMRKEAEGFSDEVDRQILDIKSAAILERDRMIEQARRQDRDRWFQVALRPGGCQAFCGIRTEHASGRLRLPR